MRAKRKLFFPLLALVTTLVFLGAGFFWWSWSFSPRQPSSTADYLFVIRKGEGLSSVAEKLEAEGLIKDSFAFKLWLLLKGFSGQIQAGDFHLSPSMTPKQIAEVLTHGSIDIWLTFPEGWRREQIAQRLGANLIGFEVQTFLNLTGDLEGYLFPDTYLVPKDASPETAVSIFQKNFESKWTADLEKEAQKQGLTREQVIIMASIVEREVGQGKDRPVVGGILLKRWQNGWPLQADATIQYALATHNSQLTTYDSIDWWPQDLTKNDLRIDSPFNTYQYEGLPPTPICNPGLASIRAVIYSQATPYWFYLSDSKGQMHYAETVEEHNENINRYLR
jgi:UPF0755 protein